MAQHNTLSNRTSGLLTELTDLWCRGTMRIPDDITDSKVQPPINPVIQTGVISSCFVPRIVRKPAIQPP